MNPPPGIRKRRLSRTSFSSAGVSACMSVSHWTPAHRVSFITVQLFDPTGVHTGAFLNGLISPVPRGNKINQKLPRVAAAVEKGDHAAGNGFLVGAAHNGDIQPTQTVGNENAAGIHAEIGPLHGDIHADLLIMLQHLPVVLHAGILHFFNFLRRGEGEHQIVLVAAVEGCHQMPINVDIAAQYGCTTGSP